MSKGLEAFEILKQDIGKCYEDEMLIVETALKRLEQLEEEKQSFDRVIEKKLKALEIIRKKRVNIGDFVRCKNIEDYNEYCCYNEKEQLTQEEYDLLKEVLQ